MGLEDSMSSCRGDSACGTRAVGVDEVIQLLRFILATIIPHRAVGDGDRIADYSVRPLRPGRPEPSDPRHPTKRLDAILEGWGCWGDE